MAKRPSVGKLVERKSGRELKRTTIYLPPEVYRRLKDHSEQLGRQMSAIIVEAVGAHLDQVEHLGKRAPK